MAQFSPVKNKILTLFVKDIISNNARWKIETLYDYIYKQRYQPFLGTAVICLQVQRTADITTLKTID